MKKLFLSAALGLSLIMSAPTNADAAKPIVLAEQGSFAIGGSTVKHSGVFSTKNFLSPEGQKRLLSDSRQGKETAVDLPTRRRSIEAHLGVDARRSGRLPKFIPAQGLRSVFGRPTADR